MRTLFFEIGLPDMQLKKTFSALVVNRSGGVGKTLLTQALRILMASPAGEDWRPISVDSVEGGQHSKLSRLMPECVDIPIAPALSVIEEGSFPFYQLWDEVYLNIARGSAMVDFGANVVPAFSQWLEILETDRNGIDYPPSFLIVPITSSGQALRDGVATIEGFWKTQQVLPISRTIVFFNEVFGPVENPISPDYEWLLRRAREGKLTILRMPKCEGPLLAAFDAQDIPVFAVLRMNDDQLSAMFGLTDLRRRTLAQKQLLEFLIAIGNELIKAGLMDFKAKARP